MRRLVSAAPVPALVGFIVFSIFYVVPGDPAVVIAGDRASSEDKRPANRLDLGVYLPLDNAPMAFRGKTPGQVL
ncbi:hypothetical protein [Bradyrhizobium sp. ORS 111]|uniref:hypothetical protein n=1 Tax=Bradyrhizobium sp. ORS 111 TaxID=1685958 RepID=UPI00388D611A